MLSSNLPIGAARISYRPGCFYCTNLPGLAVGTVGKTLVVGMRDRETNRTSLRVIPSIERRTLHSFIHKHTDTEAMIYTDDRVSYEQLNRVHKAVRHSAKMYVRGKAHTNGIESHWAMPQART